MSPPAARAEQLQQTATDLFPKGVSVKVTVRNYKGKAVLDFKGIPVEQLNQLAQMVTAEVPPVTAERA